MELKLEENGMLHSVIFEDNNGALALTTTLKLTPRTKHIAVSTAMREFLPMRRL